MVNETYKTNHQFECNEKCIVHLLAWKKCLKQYVAQNIDTFWHRSNDYKSNDTKFQPSVPCIQIHLFLYFSSPGHNRFLNDVSVTFIDKKDPSDPLKRENFSRQTLMIMAPYGLNIEDSVWVLPFDNIEVGTFCFAHILHFMDYWNGLFFPIRVMEDEFVQSLFY